MFTLIPLVACWRYEPREHLGHSHCCAACDFAFPLERQGRLLRSRSISGLFSRSLYSGLNLPVYASQWPLPDTAQVVRGCSLGFTAAAI